MEYKPTESYYQIYHKTVIREMYFNIIYNNPLIKVVILPLGDAKMKAYAKEQIKYLLKTTDCIGQKVYQTKMRNN